MHTRIQPSFINQQEQEAETRTDYTQFTTTVISDAFEWEDKVSFVSSKWKMDGRWDMRNWRSARARECCFSAKCQKLENCLFVISPLNFILAERECGKKTASKFAKCQTHFFKWYVFLKCSRTTFKNQPTILKIYARKHLISKWALEPYFSRAHHFWNKWSEYFKRARFREADKSDHDRSTRPTFSRYFFPTHLRLSYTSPQMTPTHCLSQIWSSSFKTFHLYVMCPIL